MVNPSNPELGQRFDQARSDSAQRAGIALPLSAAEQWFLNFAKGPEQPVAHGDLSPDLVEVGKQGSYLLAALAVGVTSVRSTGDAMDLFGRLNGANNANRSQTDSPSGSAARLATIFDTFTIAELRKVKVDQLVQTDSKVTAAEIPLPQTMAAVQVGGAVLFPVPRVVFGGSAARTIWGVVTGYQEKTKLTADSAQTDTSGSTNAEAFKTNEEFIIAVPRRRDALHWRVSPAVLDEHLGDAPYAHVISARPGA